MIKLACMALMQIKPPLASVVARPRRYCLRSDDFGFAASAPGTAKGAHRRTAKHSNEIVRCILGLRHGSREPIAIRGTWELGQRRCFAAPRESAAGRRLRCRVTRPSSATWGAAEMASRRQAKELGFLDLHRFQRERPGKAEPTEPRQPLRWHRAPVPPALTRSWLHQTAE
jgi:hypothetical protein